MGICKWCNGTGSNHVEDILYCRCEDCCGTGWREECDICGVEYENEYCEECYAKCKECGTVEAKTDMLDGLCLDCQDYYKQEVI